MLYALEVGSPYFPVVNRGEGVFFDIRDKHVELIYNMVKPTPKELAEVKDKGHLLKAYN